MPLSAISDAGHLVTAIVGANDDGDDRSNACVMLSWCVNAAEDWRRLEKKVMQRIKKVQRRPRTSRATESVCSASTKNCWFLLDRILWACLIRPPGEWRFQSYFHLAMVCHFWFVKPRCPSWKRSSICMRDELVYYVTGMDEYQASDRARWSSHVSWRVFPFRWNSAARRLAGACARRRCGLLGMQKMQKKSGPGDGLLQETEHAWLCNGAGRQPDNSCHSALGWLDRAASRQSAGQWSGLVRADWFQDCRVAFDRSG